MLRSSLESSALLRQFSERLSAYAPLQPPDRAAIEQLAPEVIVHRRGSNVTEAQSAHQLLMSGWACHMRKLANGRRQIFRFLLPGDALGPFSPEPEAPPPFQTAALTRVEAFSIAPLMEADRTGAPRHAAIVQASRRAERDSDGLLFDHIVRLGGQDAYAGSAHLLLEFHQRLARVGLTEDGAFLLPIGQRVVADAMGLSAAHINHVFQRMALDKLIEADGALMRLLRPERMMAIAGFEPRRSPAAAVKSD